MSGRRRWLVYLGAASLSLLMLGFVMFASAASRRVPQPFPTAEGIVVLTGGSERRIEAGVRLLRDGSGRRLLISGVNRKTKPAELFATTSFDTSQEQMECCIDLGYEALDTVGNASEAKEWAAHHGFRRLLIVTSSYHMPRSLNELTMAMPDVELIAHPVFPKILAEGAWWLRPSAVRMLFAEYLKLIPSFARTAIHRLVRPLESSEAAVSPAPHPDGHVSHPAWQAPKRTAQHR